MEKLETETSNFDEAAIQLRCKGWCHDIADCRCKGWCHDVKQDYEDSLPKVEYFN